MVDMTDVVVVGGGIGGASLAYALADAGLGVTVLEASTVFEDRVRGESMQAWGLNEARILGVEPILLDAGAHISTVWKQYAEGIGDAGEIPVSMMVPGVPGTLNLGHPKACQALLDAAAAARHPRSATPPTVRHGRCRRRSWSVPTDERRRSASRLASPSSARSRSATSPASSSKVSTTSPTTSTCSLVRAMSSS
jgi:choline dehydrogenase-like flavoprotein